MKPLTGSRKWPATAWRTLLELALPALDEVGADVRWTLGGGTGLALKLEHRISYDIDIFFEDASHLRALSPNRNKASRAISDRWQDPGHYLRLEREEGVIDFIEAVNGEDIENIPWDDTGASIFQFLGEDFRGVLDGDVSTLEPVKPGREVRQPAG